MAENAQAARAALHKAHEKLAFEQEESTRLRAHVADLQLVQERERLALSERRLLELRFARAVKIIAGLTSEINQAADDTQSVLHSG